MIHLITGNFSVSQSEINRLVNEMNASLASINTGPVSANDLTGTTLAANVVNSSLTGVGTLDNLTVDGSSSLDDGGITTNGTGTLTAVAFVGSGAGLTSLPSSFTTLTVTSTSSLDDGDITTDGAGELTAVSFVGDGSGLTNLPGGATTFAALTDVSEGNNSMTCVGAARPNALTGGQNVGFGFQMFGDMDGSESGNSGFGSYALQKLVGGDGNSAFGNGALNLVTSGSNNTGIGQNCGGTLDTGSGCTFVGGHANPSSASAVNEIVIGYNATGGGDNSAQIGNSSLENMKIGGASGTVQTGDTTNTSSVPWALGDSVTQAVTMDTTRYVEVMIDGVVTKLAVCS